MKAADIMREDVITVDENLTIKELAGLLIERGISGAPVVDKRGKLVGVVSQTDLVRRDRETSQDHEAPAYNQDLDRWLGRHGLQVEAPDYARVRDVMTPVVLAADCSTSVEELARCMTLKRIHRLIITRRGKLAGIVTSMDILRAFAARAGRPS